MENRELHKAKASWMRWSAESGTMFCKRHWKEYLKSILNLKKIIKMK